MAATGDEVVDGRDLVVGGLSRDELLLRLRTEGVLLNTHAETLLADAALDGGDRESISVVEITVGELGLPTGGTLPEIFGRAESVGLRLCPPITAAYLRLAVADQASAPDSALSTGRAPTGSITVAARRLRDDDDYPAGFYLRVIDGRPWLRGYRCDDEHVWSAEDRFVFRTTP